MNSSRRRDALVVSFAHDAVAHDSRRKRGMRSMGRFDECERRRGTTRGVILFKTFVTLFKTFATLFKTFVTFKTFANAAPSRASQHCAIVHRGLVA